MNRGRVDMATPYLREILRFIGVHNVRFVAVGPTVGPRDQVEAARTVAKRQLSELGASF
jgi:FMN-dependent NADH-azoreductase